MKPYIRVKNKNKISIGFFSRLVWYLLIIIRYLKIHYYISKVPVRIMMRINITYDCISYIIALKVTIRDQRIIRALKVYDTVNIRSNVSSLFSLDSRSSGLLFQVLLRSKDSVPTFRYSRHLSSKWSFISLLYWSEHRSTSFQDADSSYSYHI